SCGSGITAHEVVKIRKVGPKQYAYYHCTKLKDFSCHEPYISEKGLIQEFIRVLKDFTIDQLKTNKQIYEKFEEYRKFRSEVLDIELKENQTNEVDLDNISIRKFSEYIFEKGSREEKRDLIGCLNTTFYLKDRIISG
ncbi:MAG: recombinase, partial [Candidatus Berkelbacteria bacterium]|nr:recombinase [Candidatus Berkelbacteria bacterium]